MSVFRPQTWLDRVFAVRIVSKALNGAAVLVGALLLNKLWAYPWLIVALTGGSTGSSADGSACART